MPLWLFECQPSSSSLAAQTASKTAKAPAHVASVVGEGSILRRGRSAARRGRHRRPVVAGRRRVEDWEAAVERRLAGDSALVHGDSEPWVVGIAEATRHTLTGQTVREITWIRQRKTTK